MRPWNFRWASCGEPTGFRAAVILLLCLCVVLQMLGVPVTLLSPSVTSDTLGASVLEGFSLPPTLPELAQLPESVLVLEIHPIVHVPILAFTLFHPPLTRFIA